MPLRKELTADLQELSTWASDNARVFGESNHKNKVSSEFKNKLDQILSNVTDDDLKDFEGKAKFQSTLYEAIRSLTGKNTDAAKEFKQIVDARTKKEQAAPAQPFIPASSRDIKAAKEAKAKEAPQKPVVPQRPKSAQQPTIPKRPSSASTNTQATTKAQGAEEYSPVVRELWDQYSALSTKMQTANNYQNPADLKELQGIQEKLAQEGYAIMSGKPVETKRISASPPVPSQDTKPKLGSGRPSISGGRFESPQMPPHMQDPDKYAEAKAAAKKKTDAPKANETTSPGNLAAEAAKKVAERQKPKKPGQ